jgi:dTDP-glucose pyrophosphorylase
MINVLVLGAGESSSSSYPVGLTEVNGKSILERIALECASIEKAQVLYIFAERDIEKYHLEEVIKFIDPDSHVIRVRNNTQGALASALLASDVIDCEDELLILNCNEYIDAHFRSIVDEFRSKNADGGVITFESIHPRYSYVKLDNSGLFVVEASEKRPISKFATAGFYWYRYGHKFVHFAKNQIRKGTSVNDKFYICPVFNEYVLDGLTVMTHLIESERYHPLKNQNQVQRVELGLSGEK